MSTDPNVLSESGYVGLSPLILDDIKNFFNTYIKPFAPYREEKVYDTLINNLVEYYYNQAYFNIPQELKQIFEEVDFHGPGIYDKLLIAIGVPSEIITNISLSDKIIFLKTLSDFERYKGTISFFQKVIRSFSDRISIYELFIDLEGENWVFKPVKIYLHDDMDLNVQSIPYATIRNEIPSLILNEEQLTAMYEEEKLILPIKSNLILLDNDMVSDASVLYDVIIAIFLHTYKDSYVDVYFSDNSKTVQLKTIYFLWYYLITEYYQIPWTSFSLTSLLRFIYSDVNFPLFIGSTPTTIDNLYQIIDRYDNIKILNSTERDYDNCRRLRDEFYSDISSAFYEYADSSAVTSTDMYNELIVMNYPLITYINDRIESTVIGKKAEINTILSEIYSSLILYASTYAGDIYFSQYVDYFLRYLPQIIINPEQTTSYTILYNLKPYHVELYSSYNTGVRIHDKFNQIFIDDENGLKFLQRITLANILTFSDSDDHLIVSSEISKETGISTLSVSDFNIGVTNDDREDENLIEENSQTFRLELATVLLSSIESLMQFDKDLISDVICVDSFSVEKVPE